MPDQIQLLLPNNHPLAKKEGAVSIHEFFNETFLLRPVGSNTRECVERLFERERFKPKKICEFDTNEAVKLAILNGYGVGFLSSSVCRIETTNGLIYLA